MISTSAKACPTKVWILNPASLIHPITKEYKSYSIPYLSMLASKNFEVNTRTFSPCPKFHSRNQRKMNREQHKA